MVYQAGYKAAELIPSNCGHRRRLLQILNSRTSSPLSPTQQMRLEFVALNASVANNDRIIALLNEEIEAEKQQRLRAERLLLLNQNGEDSGLCNGHVLHDQSELMTSFQDDDAITDDDNNNDENNIDDAVSAGRLVSSSSKQANYVTVTEDREKR